MNNSSRFPKNLKYTAENVIKSGQCQWQSPSNIALVKYWGKKHEQIPCNPSISFTLKNAHTTTSLEWNRKEAPTPGGNVDFTFHFEGKKNENFRKRLQKYLNRLAEEIPVLPYYQLAISSENTFPHSSGIASSASAMSALSAALVDMENQIADSASTKAEALPDYKQRISRLSRLGSGSACRSIYSNAALWGKCSLEDSNDEYAVGLESILHPNFTNYRDAILLVDQSVKKVSSSAGHQLMNGNPYAEARYTSAAKNTETLLSILESGHLDDFTRLVEEEAMTLHALMMASSPGYILMHPNTLYIIERIRQFRKDNGIPICFTLDAGPNVHVLYPGNSSESVHDFITTELLTFCDDSQWIDDEMGPGIQKLS